MQQGRNGKTVKQASTEKTIDSKRPFNPARSILYYLHDVVYFLVIIVIVLLTCFRVVVVSGDSMKRTLLDGDLLILISNTFYTDPQQGDIIVASKDSFENGEPIIKRVIALEGQEVDINFSTGAVYVDGKLLEETYISSRTTTDEGTSFPLVVDEGCVFVLGDNRIRSKDSRSQDIGLIDKREILGKAVLLVFPGTSKGEESRSFERIGGLS